MTAKRENAVPVDDPDPGRAEAVHALLPHGPLLADFGLTQCNMTVLNCGRWIDRHENRNSEVRGDSDISSGGEFGMSGHGAKFLLVDPF